MIREFSIELTSNDTARIGDMLAPADKRPTLYPELKPGRKTFAFDQDTLIVMADGDFERFLWAAFDRVELRDGIVILAKGAGLAFYLPVDKLQDPEIRRAIWDFVSDRVGLHG